MTDENDKPKPSLRVVAENNRPAMDRERARQKLVWPLRDLAANLMRISRGAGKPYQVGRECQAVVEAFVDYHDKVGQWPASHEIAASLSVKNPALENYQSLSDFTYEEWHYEDQLIHGALQVAASRLVEQPLQISAGERQISDAQNGLERVQKLRQEEYAKRYSPAKTRVAKPKAKALKKRPSKRKVVRPKADPDIKL